ncbi:MAG: DUF4129 domain-containing protein [Solirubrobacteraceae bacterium]
MPLVLRNATHARAQARAGRVLPLAALLVVLVVVAAGIAGSTHFSGPRWYPHLAAGRHTAGATQQLPKLASVSTTTSKPGGSIRAPSWILFVAIGVVAIVVAALLWRWLRGRRAPAASGRHAASVRTTTAVAPEPDPEPEVLLTGIERALQALDEERDPADAVVRAWLGLQQTAEESGIVRRPSETPSEFTARILSAAFADDRALRTLLALYLRTRFGDHPVSDDDVVAVRAALQQLVTNWRATAPQRSEGP